MCRPPTPFRPTSPRAKPWSQPGASTTPSSGSRPASHGSIRKTTPANWGEFLRIRGLIREQAGRPQLAHHDFAQSANIFELLGERYQAALSQLALGRIAAAAGSRSAAERNLDLGDDGVQDARRRARPRRSRAPRATCCRAPRRRRSPSSPPTPKKASSGDWWMRRSFPSSCRARRRRAIIEATEADAVVVFVESPSRPAHRRERRMRRDGRRDPGACGASRQSRVRRRAAARRTARQGA